MATDAGAARTAFSSSLILSRDEILARGVPEHQCELYSRIDYQRKFGIDAWIAAPALARFTFASATVRCAFDESEALLEYVKAQRLARPLSDAHLALVDRVRARLNGAARDHFGDARFFAKLATRSPKDAMLYDTKCERMCALLRDEVHRLPDRCNANLNLAFVKASNKFMACRDADDVLSLFCASDRIVQDLGRQVEFGAALCDVQIVLREWCDEMVERPQYEFRCFVHERKLNAITQYFCWMPFGELYDRRAELQRLMQTFFDEHVAAHAPFDSFVIDFYVAADCSVKIIEFNPFHSSAGAGLFSWSVDRERFLNGPLEFRVLEQDQVNADQVPKVWMRWLHAEVFAQRGDAIGEWMRYVADATPLEKLSVPGTHDSCAHSVSCCSGCGFGKTQTLSIERQLEIGVRFFDLRSRHVRDQLPMYHGCIALDQTLDDVVDTMAQYVQRHPSEVLLISIMREYEPVGPHSHSFAQCVAQRTFESARYRDLFYRGGGGGGGDVDDSDFGVDELPCIGAARGKIVILRRFAVPAECAASFRGSIELSLRDKTSASVQVGARLQIHYQDVYECQSVDDKIAAVEALLHAAASNMAPQQLYLNFLSAVSTRSLWSLARPVHFARAMNAWLRAWLRGNGSDCGGGGGSENATVKRVSLGVVACDFVGPALVHAIICSNFNDAQGFSPPPADEHDEVGSCM